MSRKNYTIKFPLEISVDDVGYRSEYEFADVVKFNIKSTLLTCPGERITDPDFGVCLHRVIFEMPSANLVSVVRTRINNQLKTYMPYINVRQNQITISPDKQTLNIKITYTILESRAIDTFETSIDLNKI
jgi:phage baseplate assembly protein W